MFCSTRKLGDDSDSDDHMFSTGLEKKHQLTYVKGIGKDYLYQKNNKSCSILAHLKDAAPKRDSLKDLNSPFFKLNWPMANL